MRSVNICITVTAVALTLAVAGCTRGKESASASRVPTSTAAGSPTPTVPSPPSGSPVSPTASTPPGAGKPAPATAPVADRWVMSADGIGPYRIGVRVDEMPAGLFGPSTPVDSVNCPGLYSVQATGEYEGTLALTVRHNYLVGIGTAGGKPVHSAAGATVGTSFERVQEIYGTRGKCPRTAQESLASSSRRGTRSCCSVDTRSGKASAGSRWDWPTTPSTCSAPENTADRGRCPSEGRTAD